jgi:S1-C subfamily serine protease
MPEYQLEGDYQALTSVQDEQQDQLFAKPNVVGVAVGNRIKDGTDTGKPCLSVFVSQKLPKELLAGDEMIDREYDVVDTGDIFAGATTTRTAPRTKETTPRAVAPPTPRYAELGGNGVLTAPELGLVQPVEEVWEEVGVELLRQRARPAQGGYSVGHYRVTAGTMTTAVYDARAFPGIPSRYYILSNNHVLANSNMCRIGDPILQPGRVDGGQLPRDVVGRVSRFVPIRFGGPPNLVDAAIAEADYHDIDRAIYWIGHLTGVRFLTTVGEYVRKSGRTTNYTTGRVTHLNATVNVNYGGGRVARMIRQIVTTNMSAPGDSGSCLCDMSGNAVGLLFAGSDRVTIHNHMMYVQSLLGVRLI